MPVRWVWAGACMAVLAIAMTVWVSANAMDAGGMGGSTSSPRKQGGALPATAAENSAAVRKVVEGKRPQKSLATSQAPGTGKGTQKPLPRKRAATPRKSTSGKRTLPAPAGSASETQALRAEACKKRIEATLQPARIVQLAEECEKELSNDILTGEFRRIGTRARQVLEVQRSAGLSADLFTHPEGDEDFQALIRQAVRGDKQASYRIAQAYRLGRSGVPANTRRMEQWLRFSAELGDGRASWELAEHYNYGGLIADAAKYEKKAEDLGYRPGFRLPSRGY